MLTQILVVLTVAQISAANDTPSMNSLPSDIKAVSSGIRAQSWVCPSFLLDESNFMGASTSANVRPSQAALAVYSRTCDLHLPMVFFGLLHSVTTFKGKSGTAMTNFILFHAIIGATRAQSALDFTTVGKPGTLLCEPGQYSIDSDGLSCELCPAGTFSTSPGAYSRDALVAGSGLLTAGLPNGHDPYLCEWDACVANCECPQPCQFGCTRNGPLVKDYLNRTEPDLQLNGARVCGAASQSALAFNGEPGNAIDGVREDEGNGWHPFNSANHPTEEMFCTHIHTTDGNPGWWQVDLGGTAVITHVDVFFRTDHPFWRGGSIGMQIVVSDTTDFDAGYVCGLTDDELAFPDRTECNNAMGQFVSLVMRPVHIIGGWGGTMTAFCEVEVYGSLGCLPCPPATYSAVDGSTECTACEPGTFAGAGATECSNCRPGTALVNGQCESCAPGQYDGDLSSATACDLCPPGTFVAGEGSYGLDGVTDVEACTAADEELCSDVDLELSDAQLACESASSNCVYTPAANATDEIMEACTAAEEGAQQSVRDACESVDLTSSDTDADQSSCLSAGACAYTAAQDATGAVSQSCAAVDTPACESVPLNDGSLDGATRCAASATTCEYISTPTAVCSACTSGTFAAAGAADCTECTPGRYDDDLSPATVCKPCEAGTYSADLGSTSCISCDSQSVGTYSPAGAVECSTCDAGQYDHDSSASTVCAACPESKVATGVGAFSCIPCPGHLVSNEASRECVCPDNTYLQIGSVEDEDESCTSCPTGSRHWTTLTGEMVTPCGVYCDENSYEPDHCLCGVCGSSGTCTESCVIPTTERGLHACPPEAEGFVPGELSSAGKQAYKALLRQTKVKDNWTLLFRQTAPNWITKEQAPRHSADNKTGDFSVLDELELYRQSDKKFYLKLLYPQRPESNPGRQIEWMQRSNPVTATQTGTVDGKADGYEDLTSADPGPPHRSFFGFELSANQNTFIEGVQGDGWFYAVGQTQDWGDDLMCPGYVDSGEAYSSSCIPGSGEAYTVDGNEYSGDAQVEVWVQGGHTVTSTVGEGGFSEEWLSNGFIDWGSSELEIGAAGPTESEEMLICLMFPSLNVASGEYVTNAHVRFYVDEVRAGYSDVDVSLEIYAEANVMPANLTNADYDGSSRTSTAATVAWHPEASAAVDREIKTADITSIINEVIALPGWEPGNPVGIFIRRLGGSGVRWVRTQSALSPTLVVGIDMDPDLDIEIPLTNNLPNSMHIGTQSLGQCFLCPAGTYSDDGTGRACKPCPPGTYANGTGFSVCTACPDGLVALAGSTTVEDCTTEPRFVGLFFDEESFSGSRDFTGPRTSMGIGGSCSDASATTEADCLSLETPGTWTNDASVATCAEFCFGYKFMGLQYRDLCFCGNTFGSHGKIGPGMPGSYVAIPSNHKYDGEADASWSTQRSHEHEDITLANRDLGASLRWRAYNAFDDHPLTAWSDNVNNNGGMARPDPWLEFSFYQETKVSAYYMKTMASDCPKSWTLKASSTGAAFRTVHRATVDRCYDHEYRLHVLDVATVASTFRWEFEDEGSRLRIRDIKVAVETAHLHMCGKNSADAASCTMQNAVYELPVATCAQTECAAGHTLRPENVDVPMTGLSDSDIQVTCCQRTCASWLEDAVDTASAGTCASYVPGKPSTCDRDACVYTSPEPVRRPADCVGTNDGTSVASDCVAPDGSTDCDSVDGLLESNCTVLTDGTGSPCTFVPAVEASACVLNADHSACAVSGTIGTNGYNCVFTADANAGSITAEACVVDECVAPTAYMPELANTGIGTSGRETCCTDGPCDAGTWRDGSICTECPAGTVSSTVNASSCEQCLAGSFAAPGQSVCSPCEPGMYDDDSLPSTPCAPCPSGTYSEATGSTSCPGECAAGTHSSPGSRSSANCAECEAGQYDHDRSAATECHLCPANTFNPGVGAIDCTPCPGGLSAVGGSSVCTSSDSFINTTCSDEWIACVVAGSCPDAFVSALAAPGRPPVLPQDLRTVLDCVEMALKAGTAVSTGCTDPFASNYDPEANSGNGTTCVYDCETLASSTGDSDLQCYFLYNMPIEDLPTTLGQTHHALLQGQAVHQEGLDTAAARCHIDVFPDSMDWVSAEAACVADGGHLASLHSDADHELIASMLHVGESVWIGSNDRAVEAACNSDQFVWSDGSTNDYAKWKGDPAGPDAWGCSLKPSCNNDCNGLTSSEDCVERGWGPGGEYWNDALCSIPLPFVCGFACNTTEYAQFLWGHPHSRCQFEYYSGEETITSFERAEEYCVTLGGHLASIHSAEDRERVWAAVELIEGEFERRQWGIGRAWIGLNDKAYEMGCDGEDGNFGGASDTDGERAVCDPPQEYCRRDIPDPGWRWTDGTPFDFTKWGTKEPSSWSCAVMAEQCSSDCVGHCEIGLSTEDCTQFAYDAEGTAVWDDKDCGEKKPFVCGYQCTEELVTSGPHLELESASVSMRYLSLNGHVSYGGGGSDHGAGLSLADSHVDIKYSSVSHNIQHGIGAAAIFARRSVVDFAFSTITHNQILGLGAAGIYAIEASSVNVTSSRIEYNQAHAVTGSPETNMETGVTVKRGAGIVCDFSNVSVADTYLTYNFGAPALVGTAACLLSVTSSVISDTGYGAEPFHAKTAAVELDGGCEAHLQSCSFRSNVGKSASTIIASGDGTIVTLTDVLIHEGSAADTHAAGAIYVNRGALLRGDHLTLTNNFADAPEVAAGAVLVDRASLVLSDSRLHHNRLKGTPLGRGCGGVFAQDSDLRVSNTRIDFNDAVNDETGYIFGPSYTNSFHAIDSGEIYLFETTFIPFDDSRSVIISPGSIQGLLRGGCGEHPCESGFDCRHGNFSLSCHACSEVTYSPDGVDCIACPQSMGPNDDQTGCIPCTGNNHSTFGVCLPCPTELVVAPDHINCEACGVHRTAVSVGSIDTPRVCGCDNGFYNGSVVLQVCFVGGYDPDVHQNTLDTHYSALASTKQHCEACPQDVTGEGCVVCQDGAPPSVAAGYTIPQVVGDASRRMLQSEEEDLDTALVFRCHVELPLARKRCPAGAEPGVCAYGYSGYLCDSCIDGYGMSPQRECEPCEGTGFTGQSILLLAIIIGSIALLFYVVSKIWKAFPLKHLARCAFQPGRILITYSQITSQLGDVLDFSYPGLFGDVIEALRPVMDLWGLLFRALGPSECFGIKGFTARWLLRIVGLPVIMGVIVFFYYLYNRSQNGKRAAAVDAQGQVFFAIFFCYPTICIVSFAAFICRQLSPTQSVLVNDDSIFCEDPSHRMLQVASGCVIALVAVGLPIYFGIVLVREAKIYQRDHAKPNEAMAKRLATELDVSVQQAEFVIRDVSIGVGYSFLMDAYVPHYLYWEALDMLRKLALVGLVLMVGRGSVAQLSAAIILSFSFFALQMKTWPYKIEQDNLFRAATEAHVFVVIIVALVLKNDLSWEIVGINAYDYVLFFSFIVLVPTCFFIAIFSKLKYVQHVLAKPHSKDSAKARRALAFDLQALGLANDTDRRLLKRYIDGWAVNKEYAAFLSHYKLEAAAEARIMKLELQRTMRCKDEELFLDADNLTDLRDLLQNVADSDALVLLYTQGVLSRPWCLMELHAAATHDVPIIVLRIQNAFVGDLAQLHVILDNLGSYLDKENPQAKETLRSFDVDLDSLGNIILDKMIVDDTLAFNPHQSAVIMQSQITHLATSLVEHACPENKELLPEVQKEEEAPWPVQKQKAIYIIHEEQTPEVVHKAQEIKAWIVDRTVLTDDQLVLMGDEEDSQARAINDVQPADLAMVANDVDCVLVVQSSKVLQQPRCIARLYAAATEGVPIVCVVLVSDNRPELMYDFAKAKPAMEDLPSSVDAKACDVIQSATNATARDVGLELSLVVPNIISKPLHLDAAGSELEGEMKEIERTLRRSSAQGTTPTTLQTPRPEPANRTAKLTSRQETKLRQAFAKMDLDGDGGITKVEIMDALREDAEMGDLLGLGDWARTSEERVFEAGRLFQSMDTDGDHSIDVDEFVSYFGIAPGNDVSLVPQTKAKLDDDARP